ncbi:MAG: sodium-dependent transporter [Deltaproteobacteria bacterium]|nr:sodium-dependent transporter [Deltaproteobacteria bacterium]
MRPSWKSNTGFLLSAAGSAIGLGNIWKFSYIAGLNGGGAFVLFYMICVAFVALPVLLSEIAIGQKAQSNAIRSFDVIEQKPSYFKFAGILGLLASVLIIAFYSVVGGWILYYQMECLSRFSDFQSADSVRHVFDVALSDPFVSVSCQLLFLLMTFAIVGAGVNKGIERVNKLAVPLLAVLLFFLLACVWNSPGFSKALEFLFVPDFSSFHASGALEAVGHSFFTVSVGVGIMVTYGSYVPQSTRIGGISLVIVLVDTIIALVSGVVIFSVLFSFESSPDQGPILMFKTLPVLFARMQNGMIVASAFFTLVLLTAITSAISLLAVPMAYLEDLGMKRNHALIFLAVLIAVFGLPCGLSFNLLSDVGLMGMNIFDLFDAMSSKLLLPVSGLMCVMFFAYKMDAAVIVKQNISSRFLRNIFTFSIRVLAPLSILVILINGLLGYGILPD